MKKRGSRLSSNNKTIWIINQYASHLETRHWELAKSFSQLGYSVSVITTSYHHGKREYIYDETMKIVERLPGVNYVYLHSAPPYHDNGGKRIINMLDFCRLFLQYQHKIAKQLGSPSYIIASSAPPFVWEAGYCSAKKYSAKFIAEFRDIWPLSLVEIQGVSPKHPLVRILSGIEKRAYLHADAIVSTMPYAWKHVIEAADVPREKIHWLPNGINVVETEANLNSSLSLPADLEKYLSDHWCGVYVGSIVKSECIEYLLRAIAELEEPDVYFAFIGEGSMKDSFQKLAADLGLDRVRFFPAIKRELIPKVLSCAKFCFAAHENIPIYQFGLSMYKLNDYLASGTPTIFVCGADSIVNEAGHYAIPMGDTDKFAEAVKAIRELGEPERAKLAEKSKQLISEKYDYPKLGKEYLEILLSC